MKRIAKKELFMCSCNGEGLSIEKWDEDEIYLAFWRVGTYGIYPMSFKQRLHFIWNILTEGRVWGDELVITNQTAAEIGKQLINLSKEKKNGKS